MEHLGSRSMEQIGNRWSTMAEDGEAASLLVEGSSFEIDSGNSKGQVERKAADELRRRSGWQQITLAARPAARQQRQQQLRQQLGSSSSRSSSSASSLAG